MLLIYCRMYVQHVSKSWILKKDSQSFPRPAHLQVFTYLRGQHNVVQISAPSCDLPKARQLASLTDSPFYLTFNQTGTFYYACSVPSHCADGMLITVHVTGECIALCLR